VLIDTFGEPWGHGAHDGTHVGVVLAALDPLVRRRCSQRKGV
jgi:hypothetical protein